MYEVSQDTWGVRCWELTDESKLMRAAWDAVPDNHVRVVLKASLQRVSEQGEPVGRAVPATNRRYMLEVGAVRFDSPKAMQIVWGSLPVGYEKRVCKFVRGIRWLEARGAYEVEFVLSDPPMRAEFEEDLHFMYGGGAADSWQEGDVEIAMGHELLLNIVPERNS